MKVPANGGGGVAAAASTPPENASAAEGDPKKSINRELWQACAGPLVNLPAAGTHVVYFPQGHSEQVAASMEKDVDGQIPNYPNLPSKLLCILHSITLHSDPETDEVYAQMTLQPVPSFDKDALLRSDLSMRSNKPQMEFFCKTLTASDTSTHGGFSVPRRAAEKIFPPLDFTMQPPAQELVAKDLHDNVWTFRHIYRGQPKRHLLTTGWSLFVSGKRLIAGDSVFFIRDEKQQLLLGIRRANRQLNNLSSSVLSSDSMHIGILAAAAHAASNNSPFTVFYNPRASPSEFVIPLARYYKAVCSNQISLGMRFRMMFETEESGTRRYMGTITGISDLDPVQWKNSQWRNLQVGWDESTAGEKRNRVSVWEIEPVTSPFFIWPTPPFLRPKRPRQPGMPDDDSSDPDVLFRRTMPWAGDDLGFKGPQPLPGLSLAQWMSMQQNSSSLAKFISPLPGPVMQNLASNDISRQFGLPATQMPQAAGFQGNAMRPNLPADDPSQNLPSSSLNATGSLMSPLEQMSDLNPHPPRQNFVSQGLSTRLPVNQVSAQFTQSQGPLQPPVALPQQQQSLLNQQLQRSLSENTALLQQQISNQSLLPSVPSSDILSHQLLMPDNQMQIQLLQKLQHQQTSLLAQQAGVAQSSFTQIVDHPKFRDIPQSFGRCVSENPLMDVPQGTTSMQKPRGNIQNGAAFDKPPLQAKSQQPQQSGMFSESHGCLEGCLNPMNNQLSAGSSSRLTGAVGGGPSAVTEDAPSCSNSPSTNNGTNAACSVMLFNTNGQEPMFPNGNLVKEIPTASEEKPAMNTPRNQDFLASHMYANPACAQVEHLDSSSSATSVLSQNDGQLPHNNHSISFNSQSALFRTASQEIEVHGDPRNIGLLGSNMENQMELPVLPDHSMGRNMMESKDFSATMPSGSMLMSYDGSKEPQADFTSSMASQSFGGLTFNSMNSTMSDGSFMTRGAWVPQQGGRMRTYTKVYKRGAVGRSIDITRYSGYDELKQDLARRFGIEGQLEDRQRVGWKLVYVDHENDVLLVGDDPWEEFVNCVRCIKILSPQEVQQMSLDGDFGASAVPNQACSSSDNGVS